MLPNSTDLLPTHPLVSGVIDIFVGPLLRYVMPLTEAQGEYCLINTEIPPGVTVPIHSHADRETFYILSGELNAMAEPPWQTFRPGDVFDVAGDVRHAI